ncbi:MAG: PhoH family protein [Alphaproteobacteria bacterium]|nr:PhoH family protein [Alphaproteobacteria bacterium]
MTRGRSGQPAKTPKASVDRAVVVDDNRKLGALLGPLDRFAVRLEQKLDVRVARRGNQLTVTGAAHDADAAVAALRALEARLDLTGELALADVDAAIRSALQGDGGAPSGVIRTPRRTIAARGRAQADYVDALLRDEMVFGLGPAGTGKTYLAVAAAASFLAAGQVERIILSRPAVEAGERLGFLPGDMKEKVDPYLRPLYDALHDCMPAKDVQRRIESGEIEIAPLAFMRGRTLAHSFIILDEAQNATPMQMRMFLTRFGEGSRMAVTGDPSQSDLPRGQLSGLDEAVRVLEGVDGVTMKRFGAEDVVRHPLVGRIVRAYERADAG